MPKQQAYGIMAIVHLPGVSNATKPTSTAGTAIARTRFRKYSSCSNGDTLKPTCSSSNKTERSGAECRR